MTDYVIMPIAFVAFKVFKEEAKSLMGKFFGWGLRNFSHPPFGAVLQLEANGVMGQQSSFLRMRLTHDDACLCFDCGACCSLSIAVSEWKYSTSWIVATGHYC